MTKAPYYYETRASWKQKRRGVIEAVGLRSLAVSAPPEFEGEPGFWSPEQLLVAAVESCFMATFLALAEKSKLAIRSYSSSTLAKLDRAAGQSLRFTRLTLRPVVEVASERDRERAGRLIEKTEKQCLVANALSIPVRIEARLLPPDQRHSPYSSQEVA